MILRIPTAAAGLVATLLVQANVLAQNPVTVSDSSGVLSVHPTIDDALNSIEAVSGTFEVTLDPAQLPTGTAAFGQFNFFSTAAQQDITLRPADGVGQRVLLEADLSFVTGQSVGSHSFTIENLEIAPGNLGFGGLWFESITGTVSRTTLRDIQGGPAIQVVGSGQLGSTSVHLVDSVVKNCGGPFASGGAASVDDGSDLTVERCLLADNRAERGGGIFVGDSSNDLNRLTLLDSRLERNQADREGGAVSVQDVAYAHIEGTHFLGNFVNGSVAFGGALYAFVPTYLAIEHCIFEKNEALGAGNGAGALLLAEISPTSGGQASLTIRDTLFTMNSAEDGGAILSDNAVVALDRCTAADNSATVGASVFATTGLALSASRSIFWGNNSFLFGGTPTLINCWGQGFNGIDPGFATGRGAAFAGMPTEGEPSAVFQAPDYYLGAASGAINAGPNNNCATSQTCLWTTATDEAYDDDAMLDLGYHYTAPRIGLHSFLSATSGDETVQISLGTSAELVYRTGPASPQHLPGFARGYAVGFSLVAGTTPFDQLILPIGGVPTILTTGLFPVGVDDGIADISVNLPMVSTLVGTSIYMTGVTIETWAGPALVVVGAGSGTTISNPNLLQVELTL